MQELGAAPVAPEEVTYVERLDWRILTGKTFDANDAWGVASTFLGPGMILPGTTLLRLIRALRELNGELPKTAEPAREPPVESPFETLDLDEVVELERSAVELDDVARKVGKTGAEEGCESAGRSQLFVSLDVYGFLGTDGYAEKHAWLEAHGLGTLLGYHDAAEALRRYLRDPERKHFLPEAAEDEEVVGAWVSVDWFRLGVPTPPGMSPVSWLARCERFLRDYDPESFESPFSLSMKIGSETYEVEWRRDHHQKPSVVRVFVEKWPGERA
ncbi:hypothetical protein [Polyangium mundeleinium]|uniref:Uncharacterized protein n=1 Tax=Polyangium mundeleinium TaxID=2995306 RepID=A0ABT5EIQ4_9BACT|nr:hypothetical protein [Polyangium mundeleinium]MDC0741691.1 hypothetical protein [Polyangium mundeleinium]